MKIVGVILLIIGAIGILSIFIYTYWTRNYGKKVYMPNMWEINTTRRDRLGR